MAPQQPPSSASGVQVVTLTVYSTGSSGSTGLPTSSGGGSSVPVGAIAGGAAGGVALAVSLVLIWKYWGLVIKRTEKRRRKEAQDNLTVRENTRRNAAARLKPHAPSRPILSLNPEGRRVKFLARTPTLPRGKNKDTTTAAAIPPPTEEEKYTAQEAPAPAAADPGTDPDGQTQQPSPSFASAATPLLARDPADPEQKSEGAEQPPEEAENAKATSPPRQPARAPSPTASRSPSGRSHSPTPSRASSDRPSSSKPSRSMRMRTPRRLPDPPAAPPVPVRSSTQGHSARPSSSTPSGSRTSVSPSTSRAATPRRAETSRGTPSTSTSSVPPVASGSGIDGPSRSGSGSGTRSPSPPPIPLPPLTWASSPLHNSVLPSERPVILPRAKNASATSPSESQPTSPTSTGSHVPALTSSVGSGEVVARRGFLDSLRRIKPSAETADEHAHRVSIQSTPSAYSND